MEKGEEEGRERGERGEGERERRRRWGGKDSPNLIFTYVFVRQLHFFLFFFFDK